MREYEPDISQIFALYQQLEDDVIASMTKRMLKMGKVSESTRYEAEILQEAGLLYDDILALVAQRTDAAKQHVKALFEDAGVQTTAIDNTAHKAAGAVPVDIRQSAGMLQILEAGYKKTLGTMRNLVSTTATQTQTAFISACDRAYMQVSSGAFSYQQAIRQAVQSFGDTGAMVQYPSGHRDRLDVAMRRAVLTGVGQTSARVSEAHAKQAGCYLMELSAHSGARPEHAEWQGQLVSLTGQDVGKRIDGLRVFSLSAIGYGDGAGFKGWNCRHNWYPYYVGLSTPNYTKEQLAALDAKNIIYQGKAYSEYEISQMQRTAERKIRDLKRQAIAAQTAVEYAPDEATKAGLQADYTKIATKLKSAEQQLQDFCKQTGRRNDTFRTQVQSFTKSQAQKAVWANKKAQKALTSSGNSGIIKTHSKFTNTLDALGVKYNAVEKQSSSMTEKQIIKALSGGDKTKGSCANVVLAYIGQKSGYNVLDFRDGQSREYFSIFSNLRSISELSGLQTTYQTGHYYLTIGNQLLKKVESGKEYYFVCGRHAAIVRRDGDGLLQYLELQSSDYSGWTNFNRNARYTLSTRFGCPSSRYDRDEAFMIEVGSCKNSQEFLSILGYINTAESEQRKGKDGTIK